MASESSPLLPDRFVAGALHSRRMERKAQGKPWTQAAIGDSAGVSRHTVSRAERGKPVNFTSAILMARRLGILTRDVYDITDPAIKRVLRDMRVTGAGGHAKGWSAYYGGGKLRKAA